MKLPIDFGTKLFFRVLAPGIITAALLARPTYFLLTHFSVAEHWPYFFTAQAIILGFLFVALDMPIYMLFEGRRYLPAWVRTSLTQLEEHRLEHLLRDAEDPRMASYLTPGTPPYEAEKKRIKLEAQLEVSHFPLNPKLGTPEVQCPTRLGNLIYSYEQYSLVKYGMDSIFYWPRLWVAIDKDLREEIDNRQSMADGLLYTVFGFIISGFASIVTAPIGLFFPGLVPFHWIWPIDILLGFLLFCLAYLLYRMSLFTHSSFGAYFCATFDQHRAKIRDTAVENLVAALSHTPDLPQRDEFIRNQAVWRYLRWHRIKRPNQRSEIVKRTD